MAAAGTDRSSYHHGDLRRTLLETAVQVLDEAGLEALSLRKLAAAAGVSHNAPYMHFANRNALLAGIAHYGFLELTVRLKALMVTESRDWQEMLIEGCQAYVNFGVERPELFRVMFMDHDWEAVPELHEDSLAALQVLTDALTEGQRLGHVRDGDSAEFAAFVWSLLHGVSVLMARRVETPAPFADATHEHLTARYVSLLLAGIGVPAAD